MSAKIILLEIENIKRIKAVSLPANGESVIIGGNNSNGKSTILDSIMYVLGGGKNFETETIIRQGETKARIMVDIGEYVITRVFTPKSTRLEVVHNGIPQKSPQAILDGLFGKLGRNKIGFDPAKFINMSDKEQLEELKKACGVDLSEFDKEYTKLYDERTGVNSVCANLERQLAANPARHYALEGQEVKSVVEISKEIGDAQTAISATRTAKQYIADDEKEIARLQARIAVNKKAIESHATAFRTPEQITKLQTEMSGLSERNQKITAYKNAQKQALELEEKKKRQTEINSEMLALADTKKQMVAAMVSSIPINDKLEIHDDYGIMLNGFPFSQASQSQKWKLAIGVAMGLAPDIRIIPIREGSLLDDETLAMLHELAAQNDFQLFIEMVGKNIPGAVIIEDGQIVAQNSP